MHIIELVTSHKVVRCSVCILLCETIMSRMIFGETFCGFGTLKQLFLHWSAVVSISVVQELTSSDQHINTSS